MFIDWTVFLKLVGITIAGGVAGSIIQRANFAHSLLYSMFHTSILMYLSLAFSCDGNNAASILTMAYYQFRSYMPFFGPTVVSMCLVSCYAISVVRYLLSKLLPIKPESKLESVPHLTNVGVAWMAGLYLIILLTFSFWLRPFW